MNKAVPWILGGGVLLAVGLVWKSKAAAAPAQPAKPSDPQPKQPVKKPAAPTDDDPTSSKPGVPPVVPMYGEITVPCDPGGNLGVWDDIQIKRAIDASTNPDELDDLANALMTGDPACSVRATYARKRAADLRAVAGMPTEPPMGAIKY